MNRIDYLDHDGHTLKLFLAVLEEGSVTEAAKRLGLTQSAVSHTLDKLRALMHDPLFVKSGRGIKATAHAQALAQKAHALLDDMKALAAGSKFDPKKAVLDFTVAANDFQRDLLLPRFLQRVKKQAPGIRLRVIPSGLPSAQLLREERCDLLLTAVPPASADIIQKRLFEDRYVCFYDARVRSAPQTEKDYRSASHITVEFENQERLEFDKELTALGIERDVVVSVANFSGVPPFLRGTALLATLAGMLRTELMREFAWVPLPASIANRMRHVVLPMYMVWHARNRFDPAHEWLRKALEETTADVLRSLAAKSA